MDLHQARRRNIVLSTTIKRKVEEQQVEKLLVLFLSLPNDTQHYWGMWYKVGRAIERQREKEKETKEKRV